ncbi:hypothetical protein ACKFKG_05735 [Phormidesmis sp. 146-35]
MSVLRQDKAINNLLFLSLLLLFVSVLSLSLVLLLLLLLLLLPSLLLALSLSLSLSLALVPSLSLVCLLATHSLISIEEQSWKEAIIQQQQFLLQWWQLPYSVRS